MVGEGWGGVGGLGVVEGGMGGWGKCDYSGISIFHCQQHLPWLDRVHHPATRGHQPPA